MSRSAVYLACALLAVAAFAGVSAQHSKSFSADGKSLKVELTDTKDSSISGSFNKDMEGCTKLCKETCHDECNDVCKKTPVKKCKTTDVKVKVCKDVAVTKVVKKCKNSCDKSASASVTKEEDDTKSVSINVAGKDGETSTVKLSATGKGRRLMSTVTKGLTNLVVSAEGLSHGALGVQKCVEVCEDVDEDTVEEKCEDKVEEEEKCEEKEEEKCKSKCGPVCSNECTWVCPKTKPLSLLGAAAAHLG